MALDPQARDFLNRLAAAGLPTVDRLGVNQARTQMEVSTQFLGPPPKVAKVEDHRILGPGGELPIRVVTPVGVSGPIPVVVFYHGGGWVLGDLASHDGLCRAMANSAGVLVASVGYRLAPEDQFPAAADDAYAAFAWMAEHAQDLGGDASRIAVCGDSAGGNLAAVTCLMARDHGGPSPAFQVLAYPAVDCNFDTTSYQEFADGHHLTRGEMMWFWDQYVPKPEDRWHPYAAPLRTVDLMGLPPALILTAGYDVLRDEGERYAERLKSAGVMTTLSRYDGMIHGFLRRYPFFDEGRRALDEIAVAVRQAFHLTGPSRGVDGVG